MHGFLPNRRGGFPPNPTLFLSSKLRLEIKILGRKNFLNPGKPDLTWPCLLFCLIKSMINALLLSPTNVRSFWWRGEGGIACSSWLRLVSSTQKWMPKPLESWCSKPNPTMPMIAWFPDGFWSLWMAKLEIDFDEVNKLVDGPTANITDETNCHSTATNENKNTNENKETNENKLKLNQNGTRSK